jgi:hypothetical protein
MHSKRCLFNIEIQKINYGNPFSHSKTTIRQHRREFALGIASPWLSQSSLSATAPDASIFLVFFFTFSLLGFLIFKIASGKNWARITFIIMFVIGMLPTVSFVLGEFSRSLFVGALSVAQIGLQSYAIFLLFSQPGSAWFRKVAPA